MSRRTGEIVVRISTAWWLRWYVSGVALICRLTGCYPNWDRIDYWVERAVQIKTQTRTEKIEK